MTMIELGEEGLELASKITTEAFELRVEVEPPTSDQMRKTFVYRHLKNVAVLAFEVICTENGHQRASARLAVRTMLESTFNIGAALHRPMFGVEKEILEFREDARRTRIAGDVAKDASYNAVADQLDQQASQLQERFGVTPSQELGKARKIAELAKMDFFYVTGYFQFSKHTHATSAGLLSHEHGVGDELVLDMTLASLFFSCWMSLGVLDTKDGEALQRKAQDLIDRQTGLKGAHP